MKRLSAWSLLALAGLFGSFLWAQDSKGISWKHGLVFQVRLAGQNAFTDDTPKFGAEVFLDKDISQAVYITEKGTVGLGTSGKLGDGADVKAPVLFHALEVRVRKAGETSFEKAGKISSEIFKDVNAENLVYISEKGSIAVMPSGDIKAPEKMIKDPIWFHALELRVRKAGEKEFDDKTKKVGLEVYKDDNTNQLFYITEEGSIAITPAGSTTKPAKVENPVWFHAFEIKARKANDKLFDKDTRAFGVEVYKDENANTLIYISETGSIAVVPAAGSSKQAPKEPKWLYGRKFLVRTAAEKNFTDKTPSFGAEVYRDENTGNLVYITETGSLVVTRGN